MSSGSYFTIYRKHANKIVSKDVIEALKDEYFKSNMSRLFESSSKTDEQLREDIPVFLDASFKSDNIELTDDKNNVFYDHDGTTYEKLLSFHFISTFNCLKEYWNMNAYSFKDSSKIVTKNEAEKMIQAIKYILNEKYNKSFEDILSNEYIKVFGEDYSSFVNRFKKSKSPLYIEREGRNYKVTRSDDEFEDEITESDENAKWNMEHTKACLEAFLYAETCSWDNEDLMLEYSVY